MAEEVELDACEAGGLVGPVGEPPWREGLEIKWARAFPKLVSDGFGKWAVESDVEAKPGESTA